MDRELNNKKLLILIPAYNESSNISNLIKGINNELKEHKLHKCTQILLINDYSNDNAQIIAKNAGVKVINNVMHIGYGGSLQVGYRYALMYGYEYIIQIDADGQHNPNNIYNIYNELTSYRKPDIVIGSRFFDKYKSYPLSLFKKLAINYFSYIIEKSTGYKITDPTSGLQGLNKSIIYFYSKYKQFDILFPDSNVIIEALKAGFKIKEVPTKMNKRKSGKSMHAGFSALFYMIYMSIAVLSSLFKKDLTIKYDEAKKYALEG